MGILTVEELREIKRCIAQRRELSFQTLERLLHTLDEVAAIDCGDTNNALLMLAGRKEASERSQRQHAEFLKKWHASQRQLTPEEIAKLEDDRLQQQAYGLAQARELTEKALAGKTTIVPREEWEAVDREMHSR